MKNSFDCVFDVAVILDQLHYILQTRHGIVRLAVGGIDAWLIIPVGECLPEFTQSLNMDD